MAKARSWVRGAGLVVIGLVLAHSALEAQQAAVLRGRVMDAAAGTPLEGAEVAVAGDPARRAISEADGAWRLTAEPGRYRLTVRRLGYAVRVVEAEAVPGGGDAPLTIALTPIVLSLDAMVVTAARREQKLKDAVVETELIGADEIERSGASDLAGVLTTTTGIQLDGGTPAGAGVLLQGLGSQRVLVLLDGQPLVGRINGNFDVSRLPAAMVERVEVVRGPQSTLYGSEAMGGVVNIITRQAEAGEPLRMTASAVMGSLGRRDAALGLSGARGSGGYALDAGLRTVDLAPGIPGDAGTFARRWDLAPRARWTAGSLTTEASGLVIVERQRYRTGQLFRFADNTQLGGRAGVTWRRGAWRLAPVFSFSRFDHLSRAATGPVPVSDSGQRDVQQLVQAEVAASGLVAGGIFDAGMTLKRDAITADRVRGGGRALHSVEPFAQQTWTRGAASLTLGGRVSWSEQWGTAVTPRLALMVRPAPPLALRASLGRGYRAPDFKELYLDFVNAAAGYAVEGNPGLRPERSTNAALSVEWVGERFFGRASAFRNRFTDFIDFGSPDASGTYTYGNIADGTTRGLEIEAGLARGGSRLEAGYGYLDARDARTGQPLLGRPAHSGRLTLATVVLGARVALAGTLTGPTPVAHDDTTGLVTRTRTAYTRVDARLAWSLPWSLEGSAGVDNLFDARLGADWPGFTGRQVYAGLSWKPQRRP